MEKKILKNNFVYEFNKDSTPSLVVGDGDTIEVHTLDCYSNQVKDVNNLGKVDWSKVNPATGPIYVNNAHPGDTLKVEILDIKVSNTGVIHASKKCGVLRDNNENIFYILNIENNKVIFNDLKIDINPMIGVIGTASNLYSIKTAHTYECGGNMDSNVITKGSIVYLPVQVEGGMLSLGDLHAVMGDGEISGTGVEVSGIVTIRVSLIKDFLLNYPLIETLDAYYVSTFGANSNIAIQKGYTELQRLIMNAYKLNYTDTCMYISMQGIICANQACLTEDNYTNPNNGPTFRVGIKKIENRKLI